MFSKSFQVWYRYEFWSLGPKWRRKEISINKLELSFRFLGDGIPKPIYIVSLQITFEIQERLIGKVRYIWQFIHCRKSQTVSSTIILLLSPMLSVFWQQGTKNYFKSMFVQKFSSSWKMNLSCEEMKEKYLVVMDLQIEHVNQVDVWSHKKERKKEDELKLMVDVWSYWKERKTVK